MPEGDTIFRVASSLRPVLERERIVQAQSHEPGFAASSLAGLVVRAIETRGKHLLIHLEDNRAIHTHLGMTGAWHIYRPGEGWQKPPSRAALSLSTERAVCVCFSPKTLELLSQDALRRHPHLRNLGPDILHEAFDSQRALRHFRMRDAAPIGEAVMDQTILCGIGNIYKSEVLFHCRLNPFALVATFPDDAIQRLLETARRLMRANLTGHHRRTRFRHDGDRFWVYGRGGKPCFECGQPIHVRRQGALGRSTYWCPRCQTSPPRADAVSSSSEGV